MGVYEQATEAATHIRATFEAGAKKPFAATHAVICGSGLGRLAEHLENPVSIAYSEIPHFKASTVQGHSGKLVYGTVSGTELVAVSGRLHTYEGHSVQDTAFVVRVLFLLGVKTLVVTNAAGGLNSAFAVGDVMLIADHINIPGMAGVNPLSGPNDERFGPRFPALNDAYDKNLRQRAQQVFKSLESRNLTRGRRMHSGTYAMVAGPNYETMAEVRFLQVAGADAVGMSTVPEVLVARHCGMRVLGLSLITNVAGADEVPTHEEVMQVAEVSAEVLEAFVAELLSSQQKQ